MPILELSSDLIAGDATSGIDKTIGSEIQRYAELQPDHPAVVASGFAPLSYQELQRLADEVRTSLRGAGFVRSARVAVAIRNGPHAALVIVAVACSAVSAPVNAQQTLGEVEISFAALRPDAVLVVKGADSAARRVAERMGIAIIEATLTKVGVLGFNITVPNGRAAATLDESEKADESALAFILQTSGTTSIPKLVPRSHGNMVAAAEMFRIWFNLKPQDRCLCVCPIHHGQGLVVTVFTPLLTGGTMVFPVDTTKFDYDEWFGTLKSTWYTGSPTLHRMIFDKTLSRDDAKTCHSLRFILSGGAPLPADLRDGLEDILGLPLLDHYGFSEAAQIATNLPPPGPSKSGTCGLPWPGMLIIAGEDGRTLPPEERGEVLVHGPTLMSGYLNAPELNRAHFMNGWFKTGDIGSLDGEGFLRLYGRKDDLINRGGEKISPVEIDHALMRHPAVAEAAAFAVPHPRLGEDVAAAVVLRPGMTTTPVEIRGYLREQLASFKVPRRLVICDHLPKGQTDKIVRRLLRSALADEDAAGTQRVLGTIDDTSVDSSLAVQLIEIWERLLKTTSLSLADDFFDKGGDSLLAVEMLVELERLTGRTLPSAILFEAPTIGQLAQKLSEPKYLHQKPKALVRLNANGSLAPLIFFVQGNPDYSEIMLARLLGPDQPLLLVAPHGVKDDPVPSTIEAIAADHLSFILDAQPEGPYRLLGNCFQGIVAFEVARLLIDAGKKVELVIMVDTPNINANRSLQLLFAIMRRALPLADKIVENATAWTWHQCARLRQFFNLPLAKRWDAITKKLRHSSSADVEQTMAEWLVKHSALLPNYSPKPLTVPVIYFSADYDGRDWRRLNSDLEVVRATGTHTDLDLSYIVGHLKPRLRNGE